MPAIIAQLEADPNFTKEALLDVNVLNAHGVVVRDVVLLREITANHWRVFSVYSGRVPGYSICGSR